MKTVVNYFIFAVLLTGCGPSANTASKKNIKSKTEQLNIKGSDTELSFTQKEIEEYLKKNPDASISLTGGGSSVGITALIEGNTDIAMTSRDLTTGEENEFGEKGRGVKKMIVAYDGLAIIVNPANKVDNITMKQLEDIYTGKIDHWNDLQGANQKMSVLSRESSSGTYSYFKEHILEGKSYSSTITQLTSNGQIVESVSQSPDAIGYVSVGYVNSKVKVLGVSFDGGKTFVEGKIENVKNNSYKIKRPLYYIFEENNSAKADPFVNYVLSDSGQKIVETAGFIKVK